MTRPRECAQPSGRRPCLSTAPGPGAAGPRAKCLPPRPSSLLGSLAILAVAPFLAFPVTAEAQQAPLLRGSGGTTTVGGADLRLSLGRTLYERTEYCGLYDGWLSTIELGLTRGWLGASVAIVEDYPWPLPPPDTQPQTTIDRGRAYQVLGEVFPLAILGDHPVSRWVQPFVAAGVQVSTDGESHPAGNERYGPVWAIQGRVDPAVGFGANVVIPVGDTGFGLVVQFRRTTLLDVESEAIGPDPEDDRWVFDSGNLSWNEVRAGVRLRVGGGR
jgi:hypothetical protein